MKFFVIIVQTHGGASPIIQVPSDTKPLNNLDRPIVIFCQTFYYESIFIGYKRLTITKNNQKQEKYRPDRGPNLLNQHFRNSDQNSAEPAGCQGETIGLLQSGPVDDK
jgi:hypothetical protein